MDNIISLDKHGNNNQIADEHINWITYEVPHKCIQQQREL